MKILMLAHAVSFPIHDGYSLRLLNLAGRIAASHELHLLASGSGASAPEVRAVFASTRLLPRRTPPRGASAMRRVAGLLAAGELHDFDPQVLAVLRDTLERGEFDVLWVCGDKLLAYSRALNGMLPVLADVADDHVLAASNALASAPIAGKPRCLLELLRARRYQRAFLPHVDVCTVVAEPDRQSILRRQPALDVRVVHNGVDARYFAPADAPTPAAAPPRDPGSASACREPPGHVVVFEGSMGFAPDVEAAVHLCRSVLPLIREQEPSVRLLLVGRDPAPAVLALAAPGIEVTGRVPDVRPYLARASVFACPLLSGTGIKNKVLQAWAMALPVVATPISCGGLAVESGGNMLVAEGAYDFAAAVVRLLRDPVLARRLGEAGRKLVRTQHDWDSVAGEFEELLSRVAERTARATPMRPRVSLPAPR